MNTFAQTNVQLFNQLRDGAYAAGDRQRVFEAYEFGVRLFSGLFLPSGKAFLNHLIGTASILAWLRTPGEVVSAGLLHAAYLHGDFGRMRRGATSRNRKAVADAVGADVESYIFIYNRLNWNPARISEIQASLDSLDARQRFVLLMRLVNELEHELDLASLYYARTETRQRSHQRYIKQSGPRMAAVAERLGYPQLAAEMNCVFAQTAGASVPVTPCIHSTESVAYLLMPASYRAPLSTPAVQSARAARRIIEQAPARLKRAGRRYLASRMH